MALFESAKDWLILLGAGGVFGLLFWSGLSVLTLKAILLWILIGFGFLTLILHALGSPLTGLFKKVFKGEEKTRKTKFSQQQLSTRRETSVEKKQGIYEERSHKYKEEILDPRRETLRLKKETELNKFSRWKGHGNKLGNTTEDPSCTCAHPDVKVEPEDIDPDSSLDYVEDAESSSDDQLEKSEDAKDNEASGEETSGTTLRQRRVEKVNGLSADTESNLEHELSRMASEPEVGSPGAITVALRCPTGDIKKRRFMLDSKIQDLVSYADILGYPPTHFVIMSTYPRKLLADPSQTFHNAGLTQDVVLVIDDKDD